MIMTMGAGAVGAALKPVVADLYAWTKEKIRPSATTKVLQSFESFEIGTHVYKTISVKTLWNVEKEVSLFEFYYPSRVEFPDLPVIQINSYAEIPGSNRYIIQGTAGQGKSIFLRYLYGTICFQAEKIGKVPIFIELRKLTASLTIRDHILLSLKQLGFEVAADNVDIFLSSDKLILLLDAFDEIDTQLLNSAIVEIEDICNRFPALPVTITSRPDSGIQNLALFRVAKLQPLAEGDLLPFLKRVCQDAAQATQVHETIQSVEGHGIENLLTTPLLVTLLVWLYRAQSTIPSTLTKFYEQLFDVMFYKHDQAKPGFKRLRYTNLDDEALKELFEGFCFQAKLLGIKSFDTNTFSDTCRKAVETVGIDVSSTGLRSELIKTACLLVEDGLEITYIHRSVSEFYAARFVKNSSDDFARSFYAQVADRNIMRDWLGELNFLHQIDSYRFAKYFLLDQANGALRMLDYVDGSDNVRSSEFYRRGEGSVAMQYMWKDGKPIIQGLTGFDFPKEKCAWFASRLMWSFLDSFLQVVGKGAFLEQHALIPVGLQDGEFFDVTYSSVVGLAPSLRVETDQNLLNVVEYIKRERDEAMALVAREGGKRSLVLMMKPASEIPVIT